MKIKTLEQTHKLLKDNVKNNRELVGVLVKEYKRKYNTNYLDGVLESNEMRELEKRKRRLREAKKTLTMFEEMELN
jgi:uncharacterized lipoprotein YehR (DUF1307 family)